MNKIKQFEKDAKELGRDINSVDEFKIWLEAAEPKQKGSVTWYAMFKGFGRYGDTWKKKLKMDFPTNEKVEVILHILASAFYGGTKDAAKEYREYREGKISIDDIASYFGAEEQEVVSNTSAYVTAEEFFGGAATDQNTAKEMYLKAESLGESEDEIDEW